MRLTLRTLLSWKDGMLGAEEAEALGERIASNPAARQLHDRIRDVVGRQMLSAPAPEAVGLAADANSTAAYLDNVMPDDRIEAFERACFGSDMHLAEVAGCHEMLAELAREPMAEPVVAAPQAEKLLALVRSAASREARGAAPPVAARIGRAGRPRQRKRRPQPRRASMAAWLMALAATLLLITLVGVLGWSVARGGRRVAAAPDRPREPGGPPPAVAPTRADREPEDASRRSVVERPAAGAVNAIEPARASPRPEGERAELAAPAPSPVPEQENAGLAPAAAAPPAPVIATPSPAIVSDPPPPPPAPPPAPPPPALGQAVPFGDALAIAARPPPPAAALVEPAPAAVPAAAPPAAGPRIAVAGAIVSGSAPLLVRVADAPGGWQAAGDAAAIPEAADLLAPAVGRPTIVVAGMKILLWPGSRAALGRAADGTPRLDLVFGTAVVAAPDRERLAVSAGGLAGVLEEFGGPVAISVELDRPPGAEPAATVTRASITSAVTVTFVPDAAGDGGPAAAIGPRRVIAGAALDPPAAAAAGAR
jgi:hypothetical protein